MRVSEHEFQPPTEIQVSRSLHGHQLKTFPGQKGAILDLLLSHRDRWVPVYLLAALVLQYSARIKELRDAGYVIENRTTRAGKQVHGAFRLVACPGETDEVRGGC